MLEKTSQKEAMTTDQSSADITTSAVKTPCSRVENIPRSTSPPAAPEMSMIIQ